MAGNSEVYGNLFEWEKLSGSSSSPQFVIAATPSWVVIHVVEQIYT